MDAHTSLIAIQCTNVEARASPHSDNSKGCTLAAGALGFSIGRPAAQELEGGTGGGETSQVLPLAKAWGILA